MIFLGGVGLGKTYLLATALGYHPACRVTPCCFAPQLDAINNLAAAQSAGRLKHELRKYHKPTFVILDELGYLPIDKTGAVLLFQIITTNRVFKDGPEIFNNDSRLTQHYLSACCTRLRGKAIG